MENRNNDIQEVNSEDYVDISSQENYIDITDNSRTEFVSVKDEKQSPRTENPSKAEEIDLVGYEPQYKKKKSRYSRESKKDGFFRRHKRPVIITASAAAAAAVVCIALWALMANGIISNPFVKPEPIVNEKGEFTYMSGVTVSGFDISGKTYEQAKELLEKNQSSFAAPFTLTVEANGKSFNFTQEDFTYTYNIEDVLNNARKYCEDVSQGAIKPTEPSTDSSGKADDMFEVTAILNEDSAKAAADKVAKETNIEMKNASVSKFNPFAKDRFEYADGSSGLETDTEELTDSIEAFIVSGKTDGTISAAVNDVEPEITKEMVKKNIVPLSCYTTTSVNTANGTANMGTALDACNGSVIEPGETWSFNECTGNSNLESNGYLPAGVIVNGKLETGIGGGLCQASTTIYNAALFANMEIAERHNHLWASAYVPSGFDATIDYPGLDLKLKNTTDYQMFIECTLEGTKLICNIYGYQDSSYDDIMLCSENYDITGSSYSTNAYRVWYKDGKEVDREELMGSHYSLSEGHSVQPDDDGTHLVKPDGSTVKTAASSSSDTSSPAPQNYDDDDDDDGNTSHSVSSDTETSSASSSKPTSSSSPKPASSSTSSSSSGKPASSSSKPASSSQPETQAPKSTEQPETAPATDNQDETAEQEE